MTHTQTGLAVNDEKCKYVFMFPERNAGQNHNVTTGDKSLENITFKDTAFGNDHNKSE